MRTAYVITTIEPYECREELLPKVFLSHDEAINQAQEIAIRNGVLTSVLTVNLDAEARFDQEGGRL
jgi:hypothetical protein